MKINLFKIKQIMVVEISFLLVILGVIGVTGQYCSMQPQLSLDQKNSNQIFQIKSKTTI